MNNIITLPILIPLLTGIFLIFFRSIPLQKWISAIALIVTTGVSAYIIHLISTHGILTLQLGGWEAPYGITLVADMFAALLVLTTAMVSLCCLYYAFGTVGKNRERFYFFSFFLFLVAGVNGSFFTGDIFNLFVCFELMLISSYVLLSLGGERIQLRETIKYLLINIISSMIFVLAIAYLYGITGTLNMADLSVKVAEIGQDGLLTTVSLLFLVVFGLKAALFLYFWLPGSYSAPPPAVAALFGALLTKVGIYAIFRTFTLIFYHQPEVTHTLMMWMAALTMILGTIGAVAHWDVKKIIVYNVIVAVGLIIFGLSVFSSVSLIGSLYYFVHDMIIKALLFLLAGAVIIIARTHKLHEISGLIRHHPYLGWLFFIAALSLAGIPPFGGFIGKVFITQGGLENGDYIVAGIGLFTSLLVLYSVMKIFLNGFWGETILSKKEEGKVKNVLLPCSILAALTILLGLGAEWTYVYFEQAVEGLMNPNFYIQAVLHD
ncbi:Na+/H+ antiporter subunit D [Aliibacillus thermotolerans]|uniref:Na+/H+ antiporter subunit D n=1 Tax=Aliibacillus thermotolerans TaxID=1834418 RepID=A0ABW0U6P9_9BACI|nr:Na+/H+ antiporter subunit D [Aliibacillus thermotolerans]MDA3131082.1 Na+/H+ antiporter subunit D [Aliibacillus thermotolerans]